MVNNILATLQLFHKLDIVRSPITCTNFGILAMSTIDLLICTTSGQHGCVLRRASMGVYYIGPTLVCSVLRWVSIGVLLCTMLGQHWCLAMYYVGSALVACSVLRADLM